MRLPKNPSRYTASAWLKSVPVVSDEDLQKVVWAIMNGTYKTKGTRRMPFQVERWIQLPDGSNFEVSVAKAHTTAKKYCTVRYAHILAPSQ
jgi:hypothetical protein